MAQLAPGTGGLNDEGDSPLESESFLNVNIITGVVLSQTWQHLFEQYPSLYGFYSNDFTFSPGTVYQNTSHSVYFMDVFDLPLEGLIHTSAIGFSENTFFSNISMLASMKVDLNHILGFHYTVLANYSIGTDYSNVEHSVFGGSSDIHKFGEHYSDVVYYNVPINSNVLLDYISFDTFTQQKARPNYLWTGGSF